MRKLKLQTQVTVDGYMAGPSGEMDWMSTQWSDDVATYVNRLMADVDCILLGRKLAEGFIPHWASRPEYEPETAVDFMNNTPRVVFSNTLTDSPWDNAVIARGDLGEAIDELKARPGGDIIAYGGGQLVSSLIEHELVDEIHLFVSPTAIGAGMAVFGHPDSYRRFRLAAATPFDCGMLALHFQPQRA
jgi:dihydrofolate reductase